MTNPVQSEVKTVSFTPSVPQGELNAPDLYRMVEQSVASHESRLIDTYGVGSAGLLDAAQAALRNATPSAPPRQSMSETIPQAPADTSERWILMPRDVAPTSGSQIQIPSFQDAVFAVFARHAFGSTAQGQSVGIAHTRQFSSVAPTVITSS